MTPPRTCRHCGRTIDPDQRVCVCLAAQDEYRRITRRDPP